MLVESGLKRPYQAHYSKRFEGLYAEEIYALLKYDLLRDGELEYESDNTEVNEDSSSESSQSSEVSRLEESRLDSLSGINESSTEQILDDQLFEEFVLSEIQKEKDDARFPEAIKRFFDLGVDGKIDWRDELRDAINKYERDDFVMIPPNKKYISSGFYLPSATSETFNLVIAIDSSGSVDDELLSEFLSELNFLMLSVQKYKIDLLVCDEKIRTHNTFYSGDELDVEIKGGVGTDFRPVFSYVDENLDDTNLLLYFSDLQGVYPKDEPDYEVKWVTKSDDKPDFGSVIKMDEV
jgi:predicted metal-dependent peptidase